MRRVFYIAALAFLFVAAIALSVSAEGESAAILIDGAEQSGTVAISGGAHTITARADADTVCVAVYENGQYKAASFSGTLAYDFPESGAEVALFCLDSQYRPLRVARVQQRTAARKLAYSGASLCYDEWNDDEPEFDDYTVRLRVITENGTITEIRDIAGYELSGAATNDANAYYLSRAAAQLPARIIERQSADGVDAVSGATCASRAILRAVRAALESTPEPYDEEPGGDTTPVPDGVYAGSAQCLTGYINYMVDVTVTVEDGILTRLEDRTLRAPMSSNDRILYNAAWRRLSGELANTSANGFEAVDALSGATVSSAGINAAVRNALTAQTPAQEEESGDVYAPEGISLYARVYPVVTVRDGAIDNIRIVPARDTDTEQLEAFAAEITRRQSVAGLTWPSGIEDDAFAVANLVDQILYGTGVLQ
ncbi:MAG: FMN-binding protein [Oscillibacter sp.]|nr:FMN-binding protein [Oscillibacter sp.]